MNRLEEAISIMKVEKKCVFRQTEPVSCPKDDNGKRLCHICDLCMPTEKVLEAYETIIEFGENFLTARRLEEEREHIARQIAPFFVEMEDSSTDVD